MKVFMKPQHLTIIELQNTKRQNMLIESDQETQTTGEHPTPKTHKTQLQKISPNNSILNISDIYLTCNTAIF